MGSLFALGLGVLAILPVEVKPLAGPLVNGDLVELTAEAIVVQTAGGRQTLDVARLWELTLTTPGSPRRDAATVWVDLIDGSQLHASQFTVSRGIATVAWPTGTAVQIPTRAIHTVRWRDHEPTPELARQWQETAGQRLTADLVIVRRTNSLDPIEGVLRDVTAETVQFETGGEQLDVSRKKLDGLVYYHPVGSELPPRTCEMTDASQSRWTVKSLRLVDGRFDLVTPADVRHTLAADQVVKVNFASGNTVWLSDLEPAAVQWRPFVGSQLPPRILERVFGPREQSLGGEPLRLGGSTCPRGLIIHARTELVYRLTDQFRQFHAVAGIADQNGDYGHVALTISGDDRVLFTKLIAGPDGPTPLDLDITGVKRLRILVDFGEQLDIGDALDLGDARLTK